MLNIPPLIEAHNLQKRYGDTLAVRGVEFAVYPGEVFGFLGPNGAGKTTTIKMLVGLLHPSVGEARIGGFNLQTHPSEAKRLLGYVPDTPTLPEKLTAREFLELIGGLYSMDRQHVQQRSAELLQIFQLYERRDELIGGYSHGMRQKIALAGALLHQPQALFLDEPTVGLDPRSARLIKDLLRQIANQGACVFMSTHILEIAERMCDRVAIINKGQLIAVGSVAELRAGRTSDSLEDIFLELTGGDADVAAALDEATPGGQ